MGALFVIFLLNTDCTYFAAAVFLFSCLSFLLVVKKLSAVCVAESALLFLAALLLNHTPLEFEASLPESMLCTISGVVVDDSSVTAGGGQFINVSADRAFIWDGGCCEARGVVPASLFCSRMVPAGCHVVLSGRFDSGFFCVKDYRVTRFPAFGDMRMFLLSVFRRRLDGLPLCRLLTTGRGGREALDLKQKASQAGLAHLLALSGLHLGFLFYRTVKIFALFLPFTAASLAGLSVCALFIFLAGPGPSLVRAFLCVLFTPLRRLSLPAAFLIHILLFPYHAPLLSFRLSWCAYAAIMLCYRFLRVTLPFERGFWLSVFAFAATAPLASDCFGAVSLGGVLFTPIASFLVLAALYLSFAVLLGAGWLIPVFKWVSSLLNSLFSLSISLKYLVVEPESVKTVVALLLTGVFSRRYAQALWTRRNRSAYELEFRLRQLRRDQDAARGAGYGDVQEVRAELSHHLLGERENC